MQREAEWPEELPKIWSELKGIEALVAVVLYLIWPLFVSFYLQRFFRVRRSLIVEVYVIFCVVTTLIVWSVPTIWGAVLCSYFSLSTVAALLHVVFLSKVLGGVESTERSLILFICNVVQIVFMFSIWYQLEIGLGKEQALFSALSVLGTLGRPEHADAVVSAQIATNLLLFAIFLAHLVGRVGVPPSKNE
jgi:hypothetical protein